MTQERLDSFNGISGIDTAPMDNSPVRSSEGSIRIVLIQCTNSKRDEPALAKDIYDESSYFRIYREYARLHGDRYYILSAKHGLLEPETRIEPYDEFGLSDSQGREIAAELASITRDGDTIEVLAGKKYTEPLLPQLTALSEATVITPHEGLGIGERKAAAKEAIQDAKQSHPSE